jgi:hypothetical protein
VKLSIGSGLLLRRKTFCAFARLAKIDDVAHRGRLLRSGCEEYIFDADPWKSAWAGHFLRSHQSIEFRG